MLMRWSALAGLSVALASVAAGCGLFGEPQSVEPRVEQRSPATTAIRVTFPTPAPDTSSPPPRGPGVEPGTPYPYSLFLHCGVGDATFDGRNWQAQNVPEEWKYNPPDGWTQDDSTGTMTLVGPDLAVFKSKSGRLIEFRPGPPAACY